MSKLAGKKKKESPWGFFRIKENNILNNLAQFLHNITLGSSSF